MPSLECSKIEFELTYLAQEIPAETEGLVPTRILDVYIPADLNVHSHLRLRRSGDKCEITKKVPLDENDASAQVEYTIPLEIAEFDALSSVSNKRIEKDRSRAMIEGRQTEVDVFQGLLKGLVTIEFEFANEQEKQGFSPPSCCLADVTQEDFLAGGNLAGKSYTDIVSDLQRYGYRPL